MDESILFFEAHETPYGVFSSYSLHAITLEDGVWPSVEHAFQGRKFPPGCPLIEQIRQAPDPGYACLLGRSRSYPIREDWEAVKREIMHALLWAKFTQHEELKQLLLATGEREIIKHSPFDTEWSDGGDGRGKNWMGVLIMAVRTQLREEHFKAEK
uniref:Swarming motility protein ybiA n=1 Tax=Magnetococcus massalia (strain MO-1) TaxID=451514 RepID=A0A1S7LG37_MAGMO|nr:Swarming motility protein ybiA [Candidatus Magnetococcus massalia]